MTDGILNSHFRLKAALSLACLLPLALASPSARAEAPTPSFRIVESVPEQTIYGEPGVPRTQPVWLDMIRHAGRTIDVAQFYIADRPGRAMSPVLQALIDSANAGVRVRLIVDDSFLKETAPVLERLKPIHNIQVETLPTKRLTGGVLHAKFMIVDGRQVFVGSQNWDWRALEEIHEIGAAIDDPAIAGSFESAFDTLWALGGGRTLPQTRMQPPADRPIATEFAPVTLRDPTGESVIAFPAFSPPMMMPTTLTAEEPSLVTMIHAARHTFRLQVLTLSALKHYGPKGYWPELDAALRDAAARGVSVQIIVSNWALNEPMQSYLKSLAALPNIEVKFSTVPQAGSGFIPFARVEHCKYAVADDDTVYIGTGNWEWSYFNTTVNASIFVHGHGPAATLNRIFVRDWTGPYVTTIAPGTRYTPVKPG
ncbi:phospholipase D [Gluconacetobacter sacchari DSM 12717]|uniref:Phospholipase D n=2 Tax=Gluconacetobacter sacchari TaxID=92759 RepID=A0A7W4IGP2_9PROT|nr:phospholipase D-like domain-containing protein [Gluconacetobacter sacchari]MBB2162588.1 phospholipase [Gluconacetobacter sacchari]GBQ22778.1 phospholipase D [Gluconacetobacter sacchari DSM 12717]